MSNVADADRSSAWLSGRFELLAIYDDDSPILANLEKPL
jgi:hypothetical protein